MRVCEHSGSPSIDDLVQHERLSFSLSLLLLDSKKILNPLLGLFNYPVLLKRAV